MLKLTKILKILLVLLLTSLLILISTWIFLNNFLNEKFLSASFKIGYDINSMASPRSGEILMKEYIISSGKIINKHLKIPVFPLLNDREKMEMKNEVLNRIKFLKRKFEKWKGAERKKIIKSYSRIIISFQETFPEMNITDQKLIKITIPIVTVKQKRDETTLFLGAGKLKEEESKSRLIIAREKMEIGTRNVEEKAPEISVKRKKEELSSKISSTIPISEAGKYLEEKVVVYLKSGKTLEGSIKSIDKDYFYLEVKFKGGTFTAKFKIHNIDRIEKSVEIDSFYLIEE